MTQDELMKRKLRAETETLIISRTGEGFQVYNPSHLDMVYKVNGNSCTCPDSQNHRDDPQWQCKHVIAISTQLKKTRNSLNGPDHCETEEGLAVQDEAGLPESSTHGIQKNGINQMLLKRSVSPDGRIDSLSVEFACPLEGISPQEIQTRGREALKLQREIVEAFLVSNRQQKPDQVDSANPIPATMLSIEGRNGKWGRRLFIDIQVNGQRLKLFGNRKQLADFIAIAGFSDFAKNIAEGVRLNLPCRVMTKPINNGRFINIEKVLPAEMSRTQGGPKP